MPQVYLGENTPLNHLLAVIEGCSPPQYQVGLIQKNKASGVLQKLVPLVVQLNSMPAEALVGYVFEHWNGFKVPIVETLKVCRMLPQQQLARFALAIRLRELFPYLVLRSVYGAFLEPMPKDGSP